MTIYIYPKVQNAIQDTVFLMKETVSSNKFDSYKIQYRRKGSVQCGYINHSEIDALLRSRKIEVHSKSNFADGVPFIKIPIKYLTTC